MSGADASFRRVLQLEPDRALEHFQLGLLAAARGGKAEASSEFERAAQLGAAAPNRR
jgi:Tfp pilus assembly protein PilF